MYPPNSYNDNNYFDSGNQGDFVHSSNNDYDPVALFSNTPTHLVSEYLQGPISAPAVTQSTDDYFSLSFPEESAIDSKHPDELVDTHPNSVQTRQNTESYHRLQLPETAKQKRRTYSTNRIKNPSSLSHSFTNDGGQTNIFDEEQNRQPYPDSYEKPQQHAESDKKEGMSKLKDNKPSFRIALDMLNPPISPLHKIKKVPHSFPSPQSEPGLFKTSSRMDSFGSDALLQHGHDGEVDHLYDNVTPSLLPLPAEHDYFGDYNNSDHSAGYNEPAVLGGFINVSGRVFEDPNNFGDKSMSHENYLNYREEGNDINPDNEKSFGHHNPGRAGSHGSDVHGPHGHHQNGGFGEIHNTGHENLHPNTYNHGNEFAGGLHYNQESQVENQQHHPDVNQFHYNQSMHHAFSNRSDVHQPEEQNYHQNIDYNDQQQNEHGQYHSQNNDLGYQDQHYAMPPDMQYEQQQSHRNDQYNHYRSVQADYNQDEGQGNWDPYNMRAQDVPEDGDKTRTLDDAHNYYSNESSNNQEHTSEDLQSGKDSRKRKSNKVTICPVCGKHITRDYSRHIRIHDDAGRFQCIFPPGYCKHKSGKFNRPYDYKKHLLNVHFEFDDPTIKLAHTLAGKVDFEGKCSMCRQKFLGSDWLKKHILTDKEDEMCYELRQIRRTYQEESGQTKGFESNLNHSLYQAIDDRGQ